MIFSRNEWYNEIAKRTGSTQIAAAYKLLGLVAAKVPETYLPETTITEFKEYIARLKFDTDLTARGPEVVELAFWLSKQGHELGFVKPRFSQPSTRVEGGVVVRRPQFKASGKTSVKSTGKYWIDTTQ